MSKVSFDLDAGDLSLDFVNTLNWHASEHPIEYLHDYSDLLSWGRAAGVLTLESETQLSKLTVELPEEAQRTYDKAIQARETIYRIFSNHYTGKPSSEIDLDYLNALVHEAITHRQLMPTNGSFEWKWKPDGQELNLILWEVAYAAAELLTSDKVARVRECEDDRGCGYLFIDMSKNHSRRWCSMESCGNRAKARRHYSRSKVEKE